MAGLMDVERWKTKVKRASGKRVQVYYVRRREGPGHKWKTRTFAIDKDLVPSAKIQADNLYTTWREEAQRLKGDSRTYRRTTLPHGTHSIDKVAASYMEGRRLKGLGAVTLRGYQDTLDLYLLPWLHGHRFLDIRGIDKNAVLGLHDALQGDEIQSRAGEQLSFRTKTKVFMALKALLGHAAQRGWIDAVPGADINLEMSGEEARRRDRMREERALLPREVESLLTTADLMTKDTNNAIHAAWAERYRGFIYVCAVTGARASEVLGLTQGALARYPGRVWFKQKIDKDGRTGGVKRKRSLRNIPFHHRAKQAIDDMLAARGVVDPNPKRFLFETKVGTPLLYSSAYNRGWLKLLERNNTLARTPEGKALGGVFI